jgi:hypothetical protein
MYTRMCRVALLTVIPILQELDELGANGLTALWVQSRRHGAYPQEHYSQCHRLVAGR